MCTKPAKALACALLALALGGCAAAAPTGARHRVAIVAKSTRTEFWLSVFAGAQAAAAEYNVELDISGPETEEDYETQNRMVAEAVDAGAEALVFSAIDYENNAAAIDAAAAAGVRIVAIDSNVDSATVQTYIGTDNYAAGQMAAQAALDATAHPEKTVWLDIYNAADNFLSATYQPLLQNYDDLLNLKVDYIGGDGQTEANITNRLGNPSAYDAFAINMVKTDNAASYTALLSQ